MLHSGPMDSGEITLCRPVAGDHFASLNAPGCFRLTPTKSATLFHFASQFRPELYSTPTLRRSHNNEAFAGSGTTWNVPDPNSIAAGEASKALPDTEFGAHRFAVYQELFLLRRREIVPRLVAASICDSRALGLGRKHLFGGWVMEANSQSPRTLQPNRFP